MSDQKVYYGFALFYEEQRTNPKAPEYKGKGTLSPEAVEYIVHCHENGTTPELFLSGWLKTSARGTKFQSIQAQAPLSWREEQGQVPAQERAPPRPAAAGFPGGGGSQRAAQPRQGPAPRGSAGGRQASFPDNDDIPF